MTHLAAPTRPRRGRVVHVAMSAVLLSLGVALGGCGQEPAGRRARGSGVPVVHGLAIGHRYEFLFNGPIRGRPTWPSQLRRPMCPSQLRPRPRMLRDEPGHEQSVDTVFAELANLLAPLRVYCPTTLPAGASLAKTWWPVVQSPDPSAYDGPEISNPRVDSVDGLAVSAQAVFETAGGWLVVLENFRGDLGDVPGKDVGLVDGHPARSYVVGDGLVVQWSDDGLWYAIFARGVDESEVIGMALGMRVLAPAPLDGA